MHADPHGPASGASSDPNDRVAREAARRFVTGRARDEHAAIEAARTHLNLPGAAPSLLLVRRHVEAMEQQAMGAEAWAAARRRRLEALEELITLLEEHALGERVLLVGRAARGHLTGADPVRLRVYTDRPIREVAAALELGGIEAMDFETDDTARSAEEALYRSLLARTFKDPDLVLSLTAHWDHGRADAVAG